jgi:hypothetical protein
MTGTPDRLRSADWAHERPVGVSDETVQATGKVSEALEWVERARGHLYEFHQLMGHADFLFGDAADALGAAGHDAMADLLRTDIVGRNVLDGRWTFQMVEEFDDCYYEPVRAAECRVRDECIAGRRHVFEAELKERRRTHGHPDHAREPRCADGREDRPRAANPSVA